MPVNKFDETMDEVSFAAGCEWNEDSKICLFACFLDEEADPLIFERFKSFLERQAQWELACDDEDDEDKDEDEDEDENTIDLGNGVCLEVDDGDDSPTSIRQ